MKLYLAHSEEIKKAKWGGDDILFYRARGGINQMYDDNLDRFLPWNMTNLTKAFLVPVAWELVLI